MSNQTPHIGFISMGGSDWMAGIYYLRNLFIALKSLPASKRPHVTLLVPPKTYPDESLQPFIDQVLEIPLEPGPNRLQNALYRRLPDTISHPLRSILLPRPRLMQVLKEHAVQVLFSHATRIKIQPGFDLPLLLWIPDFQHRHNAEAFSKQVIADRESRFFDAALHANRVILSSQVSLADSRQFFPSIFPKARVLSFVSSLPIDVYEYNPATVLHQYNLPERFVYLPNQFWKHKNHATVIEALRLACKQDSRVTIVCTGGTQDVRDAGYLPSLFTRLAEYNLRERFIILGIIPYNHLFQLMRQSLAVLQPSTFEGWSTTVEEVKSLGKQIIVSDIPVHREQNPPAAIYFDPHDPQTLAFELLRVFAENKSGPDIRLEATAYQMLHQRVTQFGSTFLEIVKEVV